MEATSSTNGVSFQPGQIVGAYKILSLIGKGGAGEGPFIAEVRGGMRIGSEAVPVTIAGVSARLVEYDGSMFELRAAVEADPRRCLSCRACGQPVALSPSWRERRRSLDVGRQHVDWRADVVGADEVHRHGARQRHDGHRLRRGPGSD